MILLPDYTNLKSPRELYFELGLSLANNGSSNAIKGIQYLQYALKENNQSGKPTDTEIYIAQGNLYMKGENQPEAIKAFLNAAASSPGYFSEILNTVDDHLNEKNIASLKNWITEDWEPRVADMILTEPMMVSLDTFRARYKLYTADHAGALSLYQRLWPMDPENFRILEGLGEVYIIFNDFDIAARCLETARTNAPKESIRLKDISLKLIESFIGSGNYQQALNEIDYFRQREPEDNTLLFLQAKALNRSGQYNAVTKIMDQLIDAEPQNLKYHFERIANCIASHDYKKAGLFIEKAFQVESINNDLLFLKIQNLIEGQIDIEEGKRLFIEDKYGLLFMVGEKTVKNEIDRIPDTRQDDGNAYFFAAYIHFLIDPSNEGIKKLIEKAKDLGLKNENVYPLLGLYLLEGEIAEKNDNTYAAETNFNEAAKCYYGQGNFAAANKYFEKAIGKDKHINEAFKYNADVLFLLSYISAPPYNDKELVNNAFDTWYAAPEKNVTARYNAWHYIVLARIHEVKFKFREINFYKEYWLSVLLAERALVHDAGNYSFWTYLGRFYRNLDFEFNSLVALERATTLNAQDEFLKEEKIILLVNIGEYEKPLAFLKELKKKEASSPNVYKYYHKAWEGFIIFQNDNQPEQACLLFNEVIREVNSYLFAHQMKMVCHWHAHQSAEAIREANVIIELEKKELKEASTTTEIKETKDNKYFYLKEDFTFSWALFISGQTEKAIHRMETLVKNGGPARDTSFSLLQFYLYAGLNAKAEAIFDSFIVSIYNKRVLHELFQSLGALEFQYKNEKSTLYDSSSEFKDKIADWKKLINERKAYINVKPLTEKEELISRQQQYGFKEGSVPYITILAGLGRISFDAKDFPEAYRIYQSLSQYQSRFPEFQTALDEIELEVLSLARSYIKESKYTTAIEYLDQFELTGPAKSINKDIHLSLAYYGSGNEEKSLEYLQTLFSLIEKDYDLQKQVWAEMTNYAYNPKLTWAFGNFLETNRQSLQIADAWLLKTMDDNFWDILINKTNVTYPGVTSIAIEISSDLVSPEADSPDWYVITGLIPAMRERIFQQYGVKPPGLRITGNEGDLAPGTYVISIDEIPIVSGTVQKGKLFITTPAADLQSLAITGTSGWNPISGKDSLWTDIQLKTLLDENSIGYWQDPFDYILTHVEAVLVTNLAMFTDPQFCDNYLENFIKQDQGLGSPDTVEDAVIIRKDLPLLLLFNDLLKGLIREKVPVKNKQVIIQSFSRVKHIFQQANEIIQAVRIDVKRDLPFNNGTARFFELPVDIESKIKEALETAEGKTFLAMTPENCQQALTEIRNTVLNDTGQSLLVLLTKDPQLRIHLRKLVEAEFPNLLVASKDELI
ncbi:MAG: FHIPEP family type III secretion protein [Ferruginibacter sp.]|nr:FHIPEP family type III secretion protein [Ferruginibacter sp.]